MTDQDKPRRCHGRLRHLAVLLAAAALGTAGLAWAGQHAMTSLARAHGGGCEFGHRFARLHVEFAVDRALRVADATPQQRDQVQAILDKAFADHAAFGAKHKELHEEALQILSAPTIDRARLEALRAKHLQIAEEGSRHVTQVLADIADVLTPDQRQKLAAHVRQMFE